MRRFLRSLRPGDVVTHCFTAQPGGLLDEHGCVLPEAVDAHARGVALDLGHSGAGFDFTVARAAIDAGLVPTTVSSDVSVINVRQRVRNLAHVMGKVWALGFDLTEVIRMVTAAPCELYGIPGGALVAGAPADLTVFDVHAEPIEYDDPAGHRVTGPGRFEVRTTVKRGVVHDADVGAVLAPDNIRARPVREPLRAADADAATVLDGLARALPHLPLDGEVVHLTMLHLAREAGVSPARAARVVRRVFIERDNGNQAGWLVVEQCVRDGRRAVVERLAAAAMVSGLQPAGARS
jgi:hypothetical protein